MKKDRRGKQNGFSLIELLVVVAIILVIAAIAIPNVLQSMRTSKETAAAGNLQQILKAEVAYQNYWGAGFQPLSGLADQASNAAATCATPNLLPLATFGSATQPVVQGGYTYTFATRGNAVALSAAQTTEGCNAGTTGFSVTAVPTDPNARGFYVDDSSVTHYCLPTAGGCTATAASPVMGQ